MKSIDPKYIMYLGLLVGVEQAIGHGTVSLTNIVPVVWAPYVTSWCNMLAFIGTSIMTYQAAVSGPQMGPLAKLPDPPSFTPTVVKILLIAFLPLALLANSGSANAATTKAPAFCDPAKLIPGCKQAAASSSGVSSIDGLLNKLENIKNEIVTNVVADIQAADLDAGAVVIPATATAPAVVNDPISHACYPAAVQFLQSLPVAKPTTGTLFGVQLFQKKRDFVNQLKAGLPSYLKIGCGALLGDEVQIFVGLMGMVGVTVATGGLGGILPAASLLPALPILQ